MQEEKKGMQQITVRQNDSALQKGYLHAEDLAQKAAVQYFADEVTSWLGITEKVEAVAPTEMVKLELRHLYEDFNFIMKSGKWYHFEFESDKITRKDLRRFREYEATTSAAYGVDVVTCVVSSHKKQSRIASLRTGINKYRVRLISLREYSAENVFSSLREMAEESVRKADLIPVALCPLLGGKMPVKERILESFRILRKSYGGTSERDRRHLQAILYILAQKFLENDEMDEIKEAINMTYLGQLIFDDGVKAGIERGKELGLTQGIQQGILAMIRDNQETGTSSNKILTKLQKYFGLEKECAEEYLKGVEEETEVSGQMV